MGGIGNMDKTKQNKTKKIIEPILIKVLVLVAALIETYCRLFASASAAATTTTTKTDKSGQKRCKGQLEQGNETRTGIHIDDRR